MSESQQSDRTEELGELFVSVTGDEEVTDSQEGHSDREAVDNSFDGIDDGLEDAVDADIDGTK